MDYPTVIEVFAIRDEQIERYGGWAGVRDRGVLEAALSRSQTGYYNDLVEEAAALWESLAQSRPFIDGNKRIAFAVTYTFLAINGARITADTDETYAFIIGLYETGTFSMDQLIAWRRANVSADPNPLRSEHNGRLNLRHANAYRL